MGKRKQLKRTGSDLHVEIRTRDAAAYGSFFSSRIEAELMQ